jgi:hypothetical protein
VGTILELDKYLRSSGRKTSLKLLLILVIEYPIDETKSIIDHLSQDVSGPGFTSEVRVFILDELLKRFGINEPD